MIVKLPDEGGNCVVCYRPLPPGWFEVCVTCLYKARLRKVHYTAARRPSYESPLLKLDQQAHG